MKLSDLDKHRLITLLSVLQDYFAGETYTFDRIQDETGYGAQNAQQIADQITLLQNLDLV